MFERGDREDDTHSGFRKAVASGIVAVIALLHLFRVGTYLRGSLNALYYSYFSDIAVPFGMYFLLCIADIRVGALRRRCVKAVLVFGAAALAETMQGFGVPILGRTFDPVDFAMFAAGVLLALLVDRYVLEVFFVAWTEAK